MKIYKKNRPILVFEGLGCQTSENLGLVSGDDASLNYVQLPTDTWTMTNFTVDDYNALVASMYAGDVTVDSSIEAMPSTTITVTEFDNIH